MSLPTLSSDVVTTVDGEGTPQEQNPVASSPTVRREFLESVESVVCRRRHHYRRGGGPFSRPNPSKVNSPITLRRNETPTLGSGGPVPECSP